MLVHVPVVPGFNATESAMGAITAFVVELGPAVRGIDLLPYHTLGKAKYGRWGEPILGRSKAAWPLTRCSGWPPWSQQWLRRAASRSVSAGRGQEGGHKMAGMANLLDRSQVYY